MSGLGTRDQILDAAAHVMRTRGFARTTTKEIARAAGYSEATLYKHFQDKSDLFLAVLHERLPSFRPLLADLARDPGRGSLSDNLATTARSAIAFYLEGFPVSASIFSEPELLAAHSAAITRRGAGPHLPMQELARYLRAEQQLGRIRPGADCDAAAALLLGACFQYAFLRSFFQQAPTPAEVEGYAAAITATLMTGLVTTP